MLNLKDTHFIAWLSAALTVASLTMPAQAADPPGRAIPAEKLKQLPDSHVIESQGKRITVGELRKIREAEARVAEDKAKSARIEAGAELKTLQAKLAAETEAKLKSDHAKLMAELPRLRQAGAPAQAPQREAIQREAAQLYQRSKTASPAEKAQIEKRAGELLRQLGR